MRRTLFAMCFLSLAAEKSFAKEPFAVMGMGTATCAEITRMHPVEKTPVGAIVFSWAQGFMSGLNVDRIMHKEQLQDLSAVTTAGQLAFVLNYCEKNQLKTFSEAVLALYSALPRIP